MFWWWSVPLSALMMSTPAAWAIASRIMTPGMIGRPGKWPWKYGSFAETFFSATMRLPMSQCLTRSIIRIG